MKLRTSIILALFFLAACGSNAPQPNDKAAANVGDNSNNSAALMSEKNKRIALKNEAVKATETAQTLEKQGRQMESYRLANDAASARACKSVEEDLQRQAKDLETKIKGFPDPFGASLAPVVGDLNLCVSCSKQAAMPACVKARATVNDAIKQMFAQ